MLIYYLFSIKSSLAFNFNSKRSLICTVFNQDFEANKKYSRKVIIRNKTANWAYLRFHKVYTETWEPGVIEVFEQLF